MNPQADLDYMPRQFPPDPNAAFATLLAYGQAHRMRQRILAAQAPQAQAHHAHSEADALATPRQHSIFDRLTAAGQLALRSIRSHLPRHGGSGGTALPA